MHMPSAISPTDYRFQELGFHLFSLQDFANWAPSENAFRFCLYISSDTHINNFIVIIVYFKMERSIQWNLIYVLIEV